MKNWKRILCLALVALMALGLSACSSQEKAAPTEAPAAETAVPAADEASDKAEAEGETATEAQPEKAAGNEEAAWSGNTVNYSYWLYRSIDSSYMTDYNDHPAMKYLLSKTWGPNNDKISFNFWVPPAGSAADNFSNMIGSGDYADIIQNVVGDTLLNSYNDGISMDITEYVKQYMPNYVAYLEAHPDIKDRAVTVIDGEEHYLGIASYCDKPKDSYWGHIYRRDWIVKYGTNPVTGEAFTGGYTVEGDPDSWEDDVVFPSGGSDPIYISDWEWMFEIFQKAYADLGLTDSYCYSVPYNGYFGLGEVSASFGGLCSGTFGRTLENQIVFGPVTEQFRAYLQCMNNWYRKGWLDPHFSERTSDMFYMIDSNTVFQGKIGMWYGLNGQLGGRMDNGDELLKGICAYPAETPINDIYGSDEVKFKKPYSSYNNSTFGGITLISTAAKNKDLAPLFCFWDYLFTEEGGIIVNLGLNKEQCDEVNDPLLAKYNLQDGAYTLQEDGTYLINPVIHDNMDLKEIIAATQMTGFAPESKIDYGYVGVYKKAMELWAAVKNIGYYESDELQGYMDESETKKYNNVKTKINDYMAVHVPEFITGKLDINSDAEWENWVKMLTKYGYEKVVEIMQPYADAHPYAGFEAQEAQ